MWRFPVGVIRTRSSACGTEWTSTTNPDLPSTAVGYVDLEGTDNQLAKATWEAEARERGLAPSGTIKNTQRLLRAKVGSRFMSQLTGLGDAPSHGKLAHDMFRRNPEMPPPMPPPAHSDVAPEAMAVEGTDVAAPTPQAPSASAPAQATTPTLGPGPARVRSTPR